ncbi:ThuA domain-containing protein [Cellulophaga sp. F20128]|uniref:ThuA domain-containing protein n=1 Tax=Cellulophaga sp. F20128 TaxID=2926413 RepID=UPI001FF18386|nr:ThuA domain-containing protein [Cellulophaga sp. F20128]MCK0157020.1 ThuA domain-containing protein [Cellulophaga sp. F20128]
MGLKRELNKRYRAVFLIVLFFSIFIEANAVNFKEIDTFSISGDSLKKSENKAKDYKVVYKGTKGIGKGKHIVFIATDHEYRGEESLPALARILAKRYGFKCTVIWALDEEGYIFPGGSDIKGLKALKNADLMVLFTRFANFKGSELKHINDYIERGGSVIGLRTSTHAFKGIEGPDWEHYNYNYDGPRKSWKGGFGEMILGETWVGHYGQNHKQASNLIIDESNKLHPIMRGVTDAWAQCGGYKAFPEGLDLKVLARGRILNGMTPDSEPDTTKEEMPVAWVRKYVLENGVSGKVFTTTHGASEDLLSNGFRRMLINACFWGVGMETEIKNNNNIDFVGEYLPTTFNFKGYKKNVKPSDLSDWNSLIMPGEVLKNNKTKN